MVVVVGVVVVMVIETQRMVLVQGLVECHWDGMVVADVVMEVEVEVEVTGILMEECH
jgi:hypothetical protein